MFILKWSVREVEPLPEPERNERKTTLTGRKPVAVLL